MPGLNTPQTAVLSSTNNRFFDEQSIFCRSASDMVFAAGQKILDLIPLVVA